jgi:hypothetical protein
MGRPVVDWKRCEALAARGADGDEQARRELVEVLWPVWTSMVRGSRSMVGLGRHDVEKLDRGNGHALGLYRSWRAEHADRAFEDWMKIVVSNTVRDHLRERLGPTRAWTLPDDPSVKRFLNEFTCSPLIEQLGLRPPLTASQTARQLLEYARERLPADQYGALMRWLDGATFAEIEEDLEAHEPDAGRKLVRAAIAVLRRQFAGKSDGADV